MVGKLVYKNYFIIWYYKIIMLKRTSIIKEHKEHKEPNFLDGSWLISYVVNDKIVIFRTPDNKKRVKFSDNIEVNKLENNKIVKSSDQMNKYGKPPSKMDEFFENYLVSIMNFGNIRANKYGLMASLRLLKLYHFFMSQLINSHYLITTKGKKMVYSKKTIVRKNGIDKLTNFINNKTDLDKHINIIRKFYRKYCVK